MYGVKCWFTFSSPESAEKRRVGGTATTITTIKVDVNVAAAVMAFAKSHVAGTKSADLRILLQPKESKSCYQEQPARCCKVKDTTCKADATIAPITPCSPTGAAEKYQMHGRSRSNYRCPRSHSGEPHYSTGSTATNIRRCVAKADVW